MFNVLVTLDASAWESNLRMEMMATRFLEYSGAECAGISIANPESLKRLERIQTLLLYETDATAPTAEVVRLGQMRAIRYQPLTKTINFRFSESGRLPRSTIVHVRARLQLDDWELTRTHWAAKDGDIPQDILACAVPTPQQYDIVLSFAGEDRAYVEAVAQFLEEHDVVAFYDRYEEVTLWGKDLAEHFDGVYRKQGRFCIMFISQHYARKLWTRHERRSALARALEQREEYVLPVRFDDSEIPGLRPTMGYLDLRTLSPEQLGQRILQKLGR